MSEDNAEEKISIYWKEQYNMLDFEDEEKLKKILDDLGKNKFVDPTSATPVCTVEFVRWLNPEPLLNVVKESYPYFRYIQKRLIPRLRFTACAVFTRKVNVAEAYRSLDENDFKLLGFESIPTYEVLREFVYERLGTDRLSLLFDAIVSELVRLLKEKGILLGRRCAQDATDVGSLKFDPDAKYSGYYDKNGYKCDAVIDLDQEALPLHYTPMEITESEGKNLSPAQEHIISLGMDPNEWKVDGTYASPYENVAASEQRGISLVYRIQDGWVHNPKGEEKEIKRRYQKYHNERDFQPDTSLPFMVHYLHQKGETEVVGAYHRNKAMEEYRKNPAQYVEKWVERKVKMEGFYGTAKKETGLDTRPKKRGWKAFVLQVGFAMLAFVFAALIRVQNGVTKHLGNLTYIT